MGNHIEKRLPGMKWINQEEPNDANDSRSYDVIVVGAGFSGLLSALALSKEGKKVLIIEKENSIGGVCRSYEVDGYTVDTGPHIITRMDSGPLKSLMDRYFDVIPNFVPLGDYFVRMRDRVKPFPWSVKEWMLFDLLPVEDRALLMKTVFDIMYGISVGKDLSTVSLGELVPKGISHDTSCFVDYLSYFMLGTGPNNAPISRFIDRKEYKHDKYEEENSRALSYVGKLYNLLIGGRPTDQVYPRGGIQNIIESIIFSFPRSLSLHVDERLVAINVDTCRKNGQSVPFVQGITTDKNEYRCDVLIYSGYSTELPELVKHELSEDYVRNLSSIKRVDSLSIWLGLDKQVFDKKGTEMWVATEDEHLHTWLIPTSNYDPNMAPRNRQLLGFAFVNPGDLSSQEMRKRARNTIFSAMPELEKHVDMMHVQELVPEKACWSMNSGFGDVETQINNLYCVGSDAEKRSMGLTRSSYSVIRMMELLNNISASKRCLDTHRWDKK